MEELTEDEKIDTVEKIIGMDQSKVREKRVASILYKSISAAIIVSGIIIFVVFYMK